MFFENVEITWRFGLYVGWSKFSHRKRCKSSRIEAAVYWASVIVEEQHSLCPEFVTSTSDSNSWSLKFCTVQDCIKCCSHFQDINQQHTFLIIPPPPPPTDSHHCANRQLGLEFPGSHGTPVLPFHACTCLSGVLSMSRCLWMELLLQDDITYDMYFHCLVVFNSKGSRGIYRARNWLNLNCTITLDTVPRGRLMSVRSVTLLFSIITHLKNILFAAVSAVVGPPLRSTLLVVTRSIRNFVRHFAGLSAHRTFSEDFQQLPLNFRSLHLLRVQKSCHITSLLFETLLQATLHLNWQMPSRCSIYSVSFVPIFLRNIHVNIYFIFVLYFFVLCACVWIRRTLKRHKCVLDK